MSRPPRIPNWLPWKQSTVYFITFCVVPRKPVLANVHAWQICRDVFNKLDQWIVLAAIAMRDHLHLLASPIADRDASVTAFTKWFKRWFNEVYSNCRPSVSDGTGRRWRWQEGCFDRLLRSDESLSEKWEYLRQKPLRAGLSQNPDDWPFQFQFNADF
jgi:REP element-mobilizing transposase RayT